MRIITIGHKSPDLDAIASAVSYAEFLIKSKKYGEVEVIPVRAGEYNNETAFVFDKFGVELPVDIESLNLVPEDRFVLCDHNEEDQRISESIPPESIVEIIDHHKANIKLVHPVDINIRTWGSTSTIVYEEFKLSNLKPSKKIMGLMFAAILSDTLGLKSSTTTDKDKVAVEEISKELNIDVNEFVLGLFKAKSSLEGLTIKEIITKDYKIFDFGGKKVLINQIETVEPDKILESKASFLQELRKFKKEIKLDQVYQVLTNVLEEKSLILAEDPVELLTIESAFHTKAIDNVADIGPRLSRKKDIAPLIEKQLS